MQVGKGGLPPAQGRVDSTLSDNELERGQATLPDLHLSGLELLYCSLSD